MYPNSDKSRYTVPGPGRPSASSHGKTSHALLRASSEGNDNFVKDRKNIQLGGQGRAVKWTRFGQRHIYRHYQQSKWSLFRHRQTEIHSIILCIYIIIITIIIIKMLRIMIIIGEECPVPAGGQMGSVWKCRLLMNTLQL